MLRWPIIFSLAASLIGADNDTNFRKAALAAFSAGDWPQVRRLLEQHAPAVVVIELGANDALRGIDPAVTRKALDEILARLKARRIAVLLCGMRAPPNMGPDYARAFDAIFPELAEKHGALLYPFFLDGVAADARLNQPDGIHPTAQGVDVIVMRIMPRIEELIARARALRGS